MPKRIVEFFVIDILISIDKIKRYSINFKEISQFVSDEKSFGATVRELELIGEALKHILAHTNYNHLVNSQWRLIVDFRNVIAHEYFGIDYDEIFIIIQKDLIDFEKEFMLFAKKINNKKLFDALACVKKELTKFERFESISYLSIIEQFLKN